MKRRKLAVITARADDRAQKDIICGAARAALAENTDVIVLTNIYNHWSDDKLLSFENVIYDFFEPDGFDGVIITAEAFMDLSMLSGVIKKIKRSKLPAVVINGKIDGFKSLYCDDEGDMEQICEHLITVHNITDIDILTGQEDSVFSKRRLSGCKKAFKKHGIPFNENKVYYGDFWYDSGYYLARRYIEGEIPLPQAIVCANDCMAYQLCDDLSSAGIRIPEDVVVTGYDCTGGRIYHNPVLTTYRSGRYEIGIEAVNCLLTSGFKPDETDRFMRGNTCSCGIDPSEHNSEIKQEHIEHPSSFVNNYVQFSTAQFTQELTLTKTIWEYLSVINKYFFFNDADSLFFCLDKDWNGSKYSGESYICSVMYGTDNLQKPITLKKEMLLERLTQTRENPSVYYFCPLCFQTRLYGYTALAYEYPDRFRYQIRSWNQIVSNALEFLRLKNDIHYLKLCQRTSSMYDALTGFCKMSEFQRIISENTDKKSGLTAIKISICSDKEYISDGGRFNDIVSSAAMSVKQVCSDKEICCRTDDDVFLILCNEATDIISEKLKVILHHDVDIRYRESFPEITIAECAGYSLNDIEEVINSVRKAVVHEREAGDSSLYKSLSELHNEILVHPQNAPDIDHASRSLCISKGYFRAVYRKCFGISYVQDCINEKIMLAKYLLCTSVMSIYAVSVQCGYTDEKYFARQFHQNVGMSPIQYRKKYCS